METRAWGGCEPRGWGGRVLREANLRLRAWLDRDIRRGGCPGGPGGRVGRGPGTPGAVVCSRAEQPGLRVAQPGVARAGEAPAPVRFAFWAVARPRPRAELVRPWVTPGCVLSGSQAGCRSRQPAGPVVLAPGQWQPPRPAHGRPWAGPRGGWPRGPQLGEDYPRAALPLLTAARPSVPAPVPVPAGPLTLDVLTAEKAQGLREEGRGGVRFGRLCVRRCARSLGLREEGAETAPVLDEFLHPRRGGW